MTRPPAVSWSPRPASRAAAVSRIVAIGAVAVGALVVVNPNTTHLPLCPLHAATGLWCPLCGSTRAGYALLHGQFGMALADNALFVMSLPVLLLLWMRRARQGGTGRLLPRWAYWPVLLIWLAFGVFRNLPVGSWLAPPS